MVTDIRRWCHVTQVLLHTPARVNGTWSKQHSAYTLKPSRLPFFVDSDWPLGVRVTGPKDGAEGTGNSNSTHSQASGAATTSRSTTATATAATASSSAPLGARHLPRAASHLSHIPAHVLHFVLYLPPPGQRPLRLLEPSGGLSPTNSFWTPAWGGVTVHNPEESRAAAGREELAASEQMQHGSSADGVDADTRASSGSSHSSSTGASKVHVLSRSTMSSFAGSMLAQLHALLGVDAAGLLQPTGDGAKAATTGTGESAGVRVLTPRKQGIAQWQVGRRG